MITMQRHSFIEMTKLSNVEGRISYITSEKKQEFLYATYDTEDSSFWGELAKCCQAQHQLFLGSFLNFLDKIL